MAESCLIEVRIEKDQEAVGKESCRNPIKKKIEFVQVI